jgi:RNA polymerase sigma-70 factor, ECF subfamily
LNLLTDNAIMLSVKAGELDKMGLLFERYHRALYNFFFYMVNHRESSEDMVQNAFFRMLKYRHTFTGEGEFRTWMYHLARNILQDHRKKNKKVAEQRPIGEWENCLPGGMMADERLHKKQEAKALQLAMARLHYESREVLILSRFQDLKYSEIGRILDINEGAVKVRVHRAMNQLKQIYLNLEIKQENQ